MSGKILWKENWNTFRTQGFEAFSESIKSFYHVIVCVRSHDYDLGKKFGSAMLGEWKESRDYSRLYTQPSFCLVVGCWNDKKRSPDLSFCRVPKVITNQGVKIWKFCRLNDDKGVQGTESIREWPWNSFSVRSMSESVKTITWTDKSEYIWKRKNGLSTEENCVAWLQSKGLLNLLLARFSQCY